MPTAILILFLFVFFTTPIFAASSNVVLNETHPQPTAGADWIELYNMSTSEVDISSWKLLDTAISPMKTVPDGTKLGPNTFLVFEVSNRLNNSGDTIKLVDTNGAEIDLFNYTSSTENKSYSRIPNGKGEWFGNQNPTKEASNGTNPPK